MRIITIFALLLVSIALIAGCGARSSNPSFDPAIVAQFDDLLSKARTAASAEGITLMVSAPGKEYCNSLGVSNVATGAPMGPDKLFHIASISKTFTTTVALQLADEGLISLDDKVNVYLTGVPSGDAITLRMLFNHTSGLPNYTASTVFWADLFADKHRVFTPQELLNYAFALPMQSAPGVEYHYSNTNTTILGMIIEQKNSEHETLAQAVVRRVINKIGLQHTYFATTDAFPGDYIHGYQTNTTPGTREEWSEYSVSWMWAAGAVLSNLRDLKTYVKAISTNNANLLSAAMQAKRVNDDWIGIAPSLPTCKYGLGWFQAGGFFGHDGAVPGYHSVAGYDPSTDTTVVAVMNTEPPDTGTALSILIRVIQILYPARPI